MKKLGSRRLPGPNLLWSRAGAVVDVEFGDTPSTDATVAWETEARILLDAVGWTQEQTCVRKLSGGAAFAVSAPVDGLYAAVTLNDLAFERALQKLEGQSTLADLDETAAMLRQTIAQESNPALTALINQASRAGVTVLLDPDECSVGMGSTCEVWPINALPEPASLQWQRYRDIPVGLITGTNGKTTSARFMAAIAKSAGLVPGMSSTDGIVIDGELITPGDYSGPGGARAVLRHPRSELAVLETARGGLLRRGLGVTHADAALITNIAADHMGQFGVNTLEELADVKWTVSRALSGRTPLILNAEDPLLVERGMACELNVIWFTVDQNNDVLRQHIASGGIGCTVVNGNLSIVSSDVVVQLLPVDEMPLSHGGRATHNIMNALGVIGLAQGLGMPHDAIVNGLRSSDEGAHEGRSNVFRIKGATALVDYAHNPHGLAALLSFASTFDAQRRLLLIGHAGDRRDEDVRDLVRSTTALKFDKVIIKSLESFRRGREPGVIEDILRQQFLEQGMKEEHIAVVDSEMMAVEMATMWAQPGDLLVLLTHEAKAEVISYLKIHATAHDPSDDS